MMRTPPPTIAYELFDCLQVNLAVLADEWHGAGTHLRLGATLRFAPEAGDDGLPTVARTVEQHLADARSALGIAVRALHRTPATPGIPLDGGCYVVSDAYHLPWVPYFRQRHMAHSFLAEADGVGGVRVVDGYHNETRWGSARPGLWTLPADEFGAAVSGPTVPGPSLVGPTVPGPSLVGPTVPGPSLVGPTVPGPSLVGPAVPGPAVPGPAVAGPDLVAELAPAPLGAAAAAVSLAGPEAVDAYVDAYARHPDRSAALDRLTLETWFLARSRKLHGAFRAEFGPPPDSSVDAHLRAWDSLTEQTYLAARRVERGRAEPPAPLLRLREQLHADSVVFGDVPAAADGTGRDAGADAELRGTVAGVAAAVLGTGVEPLLAGRLLSEVPRFSSFRIVEIVERLEDELHFEFDAEDLVPENLHDIDAICAIVRRSLNAGPALAHLEEA
ncbi:hypothetical protein [Streptomyces humi]|uniref:hypothetical protein n=1 Tax=Streptomyces humi TaxID=1428620 RepID=UPI00062886DE|nr:hypothetical protein [Streptomyces humi]